MARRPFRQRRPKHKLNRATRRRQLQKNLPGILVLAATTLLALLLFYAIYRIILAPLYDILAEPALARDWIAGFGVWGPIVFILLNVIRVVVAFIPGEPFEIGAGFIFGPWLGTLLCVIGVTIGSIIAFLLTRIFGLKLLNRLFGEQATTKLNFDFNQKSVGRALFIFFLIPATPKDFMTYAAGLTRISLLNYIAIVVMARFPSIVSSTFGGQALSSQNYGIAAAIFIAGTVFSLVLYFLYERFVPKDA